MVLDIRQEHLFSVPNWIMLKTIKIYLNRVLLQLNLTSEFSLWWKIKCNAITNDRCMLMNTRKSTHCFWWGKVNWHTYCHSFPLCGTFPGKPSWNGRDLLWNSFFLMVSIKMKSISSANLCICWHERGNINSIYRTVGNWSLRASKEINYLRTGCMYVLYGKMPIQSLIHFIHKF